MKKVILTLLILVLGVSVRAESKTIENLNQYFQYLPNAVHKNWTPYKSNKDYEVVVQFIVKKNGEVSDINIINSTNDGANLSVINAVKSGSPYKPLPDSFKQDSVKTQMELKYIK